MAHFGDQHHDIIVIGASLGGVEALGRLVAQLPEDLPAAVFVVIHTAANSRNLLPQILANRGRLRVKPAVDGEMIHPGTVYVARPDHHLLVHGDRVGVKQGPKENRFRPAIDPMFRSAAVAYGARCIGVVLTGLLDDGSAGLAAIKECGGIAIVQSPEDAVSPDMPLNALSRVKVDYSVPLSQMGATLVSVVHQPVTGPDPLHVHPGLRIEAKIAETVQSHADQMGILGEQVPLSCPDCGGPLWKIKDPQVTRYRCHVGHALSEKTLLEAQEESIEEALWVAVRSLEEKVRLLETLNEREGLNVKDQLFKSKKSVEMLRKVLTGGQGQPVVPEDREQPPKSLSYG